MADTVTPIRDGGFAFDPRLYPAVRTVPDRAAALLGHHTLPETVEVPVWAYLVRTDDGPCLIDTGGGHVMGDGFGGLARELHRIGLMPTDIVRIYLTHLHGDHCGGLIASDGTAAFPNARIAVPDAEIVYWLETTLPAGHRPVAEDARQALAPYEAGLERILPGQQVGLALAVDAAGHTPGHMAWLFRDAQAIACGDMLHMREVALAHPDWSTDWDMNATQATTTRLALMRRAAREGLALLSCHGGPIAPTDVPHTPDAVSA